LQIVYSTSASGIYLANVDGRGARLLKGRHRRWYGFQNRSYRTELFAESFSPDGGQIAYVDGMGDWGNSVRVMDADGSHVRVLVDWRRARGRQKDAMDNHVHRLAWSPDGSRLAYATWKEWGTWSGVRLRIADADGSHVQTFAHIDTDPWEGFTGPGPWNPLEGASSKD
jgi:Tol biopolymer transport system component